MNAMLDAILLHPAMFMTIYPTLLILLIVAVLEVWRLGQDEPEWTYDDYKAPVAVRPGTRRYVPIMDDQTQLITRPLPRVEVRSETPLFDELWDRVRAKRDAHDILVELGRKARVA